MRQKGYLRTPDNVYVLSPKITTIGREGCDLVIQSQTVDDQHAVIEFVETEDSFVLKDLDSNQGTYVNDCRVQNAAVRLAPGDVIRFGYPGQQYEFAIESSPQVVYPPVSQPRPTWHSQQASIRFLNESSGGGGVPLPNISPNLLAPKPSAPQQPIQPILNAWGNSPYPPNNARLSRPSSATRKQPTAPAPPRGGWVSGGTRVASYSPGRESPVSELIIQEKEAKLMQLQSEIARLQSGDVENPHALEVLRQQVAALQIQLNSLAADTSVRAKLNQLEHEVASKKSELAELRDRLQQMSQAPTTGIAVANNTADAMELLSVRSELDRVRKDKQITSGLVNQLQKDMSNKDSAICRLNREVEALKRAVEEKETNLARLQTSAATEDGRRVADARDRELVALRQKFKVAENKVQEQSGFIHALKADVDKANAELRNTEERLSTTVGQLEEAKLEYLDMQRSERIARVDMQEATKRFERLRNRAMQVAFSVGQSQQAEGEVKDDEIIEMLKKILDERNKAVEKLTATEQELQSRGSVRQEMEEGTAKWAAHLVEMNNRLRAATNLTSGLSDEVMLLETEPVSDFLHAVRDATAAAMRLQLDWHREVEGALETCGVNTRLSSERPKQHILDLNSKLETSRAEIEQVRERLQKMTADHEAELKKLAESLTVEREEAVKDALERSQLTDNSNGSKSDENSRQAVEAAVSEKVAHYESLLADDNRKMEELNGSISQLQQSLIDKQSEFEGRMKDAETAMVKIEALQETVAELEKDLAISRADVQKFSEQAASSQAETKRLTQELKTSRSSPTVVNELEKVRAELQAARDELARQVEAQKSSGSRRGSQESRARSTPAASSDVEKLREELLAAREELACKEDAEKRAAELQVEVAALRQQSSMADEVDALKLELAASEESRAILLARLQEREDERSDSERGRLTDEVERLLKENVSVTVEVERLKKENTISASEMGRLQEEKTTLSVEVERLMEDLKKKENEDARSMASRRSSIDAKAVRTELEEATSRIRQLSAELEGMRNQQQVDDLVTDLQARLAASELAVTRLNGELELTRNLAQKVEEMEAKEVTVKLELNEEKTSRETDIEAYKLQVHQHSVTICSLEERVSNVVKENQELQGRVADLTKENKNLRKRRSVVRAQQDNESSSAMPQQRNTSHVPMPAPVMPTSHIEVAALERSLLGLRQENASMKKGLAEKEKLITGLRQDLSGATARLSDMQGELTDEQKQEIHAARTEVLAIQDRFDESQSKLAQLSKMVDNLNETISQRDKAIKTHTATISDLERKIKERETQLTEAEKVVEQEKTRSATQFQSMEDEGRINTELTAMGAQCRGERHEQIICHQKEALAELRARVKKLETIRAPLPSHDQAVQQVVLLKKELAEMRASMALKENKLHLRPSGVPAIMEDRRTANANNGPDTKGYVSEGDFEQQRLELTASMEEERSAHRQTMQALEESEKSFNDMLRALAITIQLESVAGITSIAHLSDNERNMVQSEREQAVATICQRIKVLMERLERKEDLLQNYEQDLARLSQAEMLATKKHDQVEKLVKDVRARTEESAMLRQSLNNTREILNREKLLNEAIKQKKTFHMEVKKMPKPPLPQVATQPKQHCPREDVFNREEQRKQRQKEREKRKNYEISTLKSKLSTRERELTRTTTRLAAMETTMRGDRDPFDDEGLTADSALD